MDVKLSLRKFLNKLAFGKNDDDPKCCRTHKNEFSRKESKVATPLLLRTRDAGHRKPSPTPRSKTARGNTAAPDFVEKRLEDQVVAKRHKYIQGTMVKTSPARAPVARCGEALLQQNTTGISNKMKSSSDLLSSRLLPAIPEMPDDTRKKVHTMKSTRHQKWEPHTTHGHSGVNPRWWIKSTWSNIFGKTKKDTTQMHKDIVPQKRKKKSKKYKRKVKGICSRASQTFPCKRAIYPYPREFTDRGPVVDVLGTVPIQVIRTESESLPRSATPSFKGIRPKKKCGRKFPKRIDDLNVEADILAELAKSPKTLKTRIILIQRDRSRVTRKSSVKGYFRKSHENISVTSSSPGSSHPHESVVYRTRGRTIVKEFLPDRTDSSFKTENVHKVTRSAIMRTSWRASLTQLGQRLEKSADTIWRSVLREAPAATVEFHHHTPEDRCEISFLNHTLSCLDKAAEPEDVFEDSAVQREMGDSHTTKDLPA